MWCRGKSPSDCRDLDDCYRRVSRVQFWAFRLFQFSARPNFPFVLLWNEYFIASLTSTVWKAKALRAWKAVSLEIAAYRPQGASWVWSTCGVESRDVSGIVKVARTIQCGSHRSHIRKSSTKTKVSINKGLARREQFK